MNTRSILFSDTPRSRAIALDKVECPACESEIIVQTHPPKANAYDPLSMNGIVRLKCECGPLDFQVDPFTRQDELDLLRDFIDKKCEAGFLKKYGPPQHGKTMVEWVKFMMNFEQRGKA